MHKFGSNSFRKYFTVISLIIIFCFIILGIAMLGFVSSYWQEENGDLLLENAQSISAMTSRIIDKETIQINRASAIIMCNTLSVVSNSINADAFVVDLTGKVILCKERSSGTGILFSAPICH